MAKKDPQPQARLQIPLRGALLAAALVACTVVLVLCGARKHAPSPRVARTRSPALSGPTITDASWRGKEEAPQPEAAVPASEPADWSAFAPGAAKRQRYEKSVVAALKPIQGLAVYVSHHHEKENG